MNDSGDPERGPEAGQGTAPGSAPRTPTVLPGVPQPAHRRRLSSAQILHGDGEIEIDHGGALYRLRVTSLGKLILTK